jgi:hypothetical protein
VPLRGIIRHAHARCARMFASVIGGPR